MQASHVHAYIRTPFSMLHCQHPVIAFLNQAVVRDKLCESVRHYASTCARTPLRIAAYKIPINFHHAPPMTNHTKR